MLFYRKGCICSIEARGDLLSTEAQPLRLLLIGLLILPVAIVIVGSRRQHVGIGLAVSGVVGAAGAVAWVVMYRFLTPA